ncbi:MAG: acyltransferase, partial [Hyphomonadaceae bacterium]
YAPWDWHVHSTHNVEALRYGVLITNPWRLTLLFLVSGAALGFLCRKLDAGAALKQRMARLLPPYLFGIFVLVPPQAYLEALDKGWTHLGFVEWWRQEYNVMAIANGVPINHLWFVLYIIVYSLAALALLAKPAWHQGAQDWLARNLGGWRLIVLPILFLFVVRQALFPFFGITNNLFNDWHHHATALGVFLFGFLIAAKDSVWQDFEKLRWHFLAIAIIALPLLMALEAHPGGMAYFGLVKNSMFAIDQWATLGAVIGFAARYLRKADGPVLRYLSAAIFPCYLAHQTLLVIFIYIFKDAGLPLSIEAPLLIALTLGGSLLIYEIVRRIDPIRPLWGLKPRDEAEARKKAAEGARS